LAQSSANVTHYIAVTLYDVDHLEPISDVAKEDHIASVRKAADISPQLGPRSAE
jgi:hypothetical protein